MRIKPQTSYVDERIFESFGQNWYSYFAISGLSQFKISSFTFNVFSHLNGVSATFINFYGTLNCSQVFHGDLGNLSFYKIVIQAYSNVLLHAIKFSSNYTFLSEML